jgi:ubiquinol-cytochrome c reductase cytochrome b subunit
MQPALGIYVVIARLLAALYFLFFELMPFYTSLETVKPVPERVVFHAH